MIVSTVFEEQKSWNVTSSCSSTSMDLPDEITYLHAKVLCLGDNEHIGIRKGHMDNAMKLRSLRKKKVLATHRPRNNDVQGLLWPQRIRLEAR